MSRLLDQTMQDRFIWPDNLLTDASAVGDARWWVLHTRARAEKALARRLVRQCVPFFLPMYQQRTRVQRRQVTRILPLMPGYVFLFGDQEAQRTSLETNYVAGCLYVAEQQELLRDLTRLHELVQTGAEIQPEHQLQPGTRAEITAGPLANMRGTIIRANGATRLVVAVDFLQRGASIEVESSEIRPL